MTGSHTSSTHPPLPPTTEDDLIAHLRLLRSRRVGIATYNRLIAEHCTVQNALAALPDIAAASGVSDYKACPVGTAQAELAAGRRAKAQLILQSDARYPENLKDIDDAPPMLWVRGDLSLLNRPMVALVAARNASSLGTRMARRMAEDLAKAGYIVVSGLARGVDTAAHLAAGDKTVAVMAGGVDIIYPQENTTLAQSIAQNAAMLSEMAMGIQPQARHFPNRNRIISGLARAVVVIEAAAKSGSLITARNALDQGREVFAVPGHPFDARAAGCNMLLRDGATLVRGADDVIDALGPLETPQAQPQLPLQSTPQRPLRETAALHSQILARLGPSPVAEDQLIRDLAAPQSQVAPAIVDLELDGQIVRSAGGLLARAV